MAACSSASWISSSVAPLVTAPRTWTASSCIRFSAVSMAMFRRLRVLRSRPGRVQISPQQYSVTSSCTGRLNSVTRSRERSTCSVPRTSRRAWRPRSNRSPACCVVMLALPVVENSRTGAGGVGRRVLIVFHRLVPLGSAEGDGQVEQVTARRRAVPVHLAGGDPHRVADAESSRRVALGAHEAAAGRDVQHLAGLMAMPVRTGAGGEEDVVDRGAVGGGQHGVGPHGAGEGGRALFGTGGGGA